MPTRPMRVMDVAELALEADSSASFRAAVLLHLQRTLGFDRGTLLCTPINGHWSAVSLNGDAKEVALGIGGWFATDSNPALLRRTLASSWIDREVLSADYRSKAPAYLEYFRPNRTREWLGRTWLGAGTISTMELARCGIGPSYGEREIRGFDLLLPAISAGEALWHGKERLRPLESALEQRIEAMLPPREASVVRLVVRGLTNREISVVLGLSVHTIRNLLVRSFARLGATTRTELVHALMNDGNHQDREARKRQRTAASRAVNPVWREIEVALSDRGDAVACADAPWPGTGGIQAPSGPRTGFAVHTGFTNVTAWSPVG